MKKRKREINTITRPLEKKILNSIAPKVPEFITPNHFSFSAIASGALIGLFYYLSKFDRHFLFLSSLFLLFHWFFDSMDGTLARYRKIASEGYGYYLDHFCDMLTVLFISFGLALSNIMNPFLALLIAIIYYLFSINTFLVSNISNKFSISFFKIGPTEARLFLIILNTLAFFITEKFTFFNFQLSLFDIVFGILEIFGFLFIIIKFIRTARDLYKKEYPYGQIRK